MREGRLAPADGDVQAGVFGTDEIRVRELEFFGTDELGAHGLGLFDAFFGQGAFLFDGRFTFGMSQHEDDFFIAADALEYIANVGEAVRVRDDFDGVAVYAGNGRLVVVRRGGQGYAAGRRQGGFFRRNGNRGGRFDRL